MTLGIRNYLYKSILRQNVGWFDNKSHTPGVLTNILSSET